MSAQITTTKLTGKSVLVLGGTSGIGFAIASAALSQGARVTVSSSSAAHVAAAVSQLRAANPSGSVDGHDCDLADTAGLEERLDALIARCAPLHHVAFTAGDWSDSPMLELTVPALHAALAVRFVAATMLAKVLPRHMALDPGCSLTLTTGASVERPIPGRAVLVAVGGAVEGLARGLAVDLKPLRVNVVAPGPVLTERMAKFSLQQGAEATRKRFQDKLLVGEAARPEDTAEAYLYVMKDRGVTGSIIKTNGGYLLS